MSGEHKGINTKKLLSLQAVVAEFINRAGEQAEFDKNITRLVDKICIKGREKIVFVMKDGTVVKRVLMN